MYFRLLGAHIGANVFIRTNDIDAPDLVVIGKDAIIGKGAAIGTTCVEQGLLRIGRCEIGAGASIGVMAVVGHDTRIGAGAMLDDMSAFRRTVNIPARRMLGRLASGAAGCARANGSRRMSQPVQRILVTLGLAWRRRCCRWRPFSHRARTDRHDRTGLGDQRL